MLFTATAQKTTKNPAILAIKTIQNLKNNKNMFNWDHLVMIVTNNTLESVGLEPKTRVELSVV